MRLGSQSRLRSELDRAKADLDEAHRKEIKHNEGVTVAGIELLTLKKSFEAKSKELEQLTTQMKEMEQCHDKEIKV